MSRTWKRANGYERKELRKKDIRAAALALNGTCPFSEMTLADIARYASFTRSNLYKYYPSREDLFLKLLEEEFQTWIGKTEEVFSRRDYGLKEFSHIWVDITMQCPRLLELLSLSISLLEKHAGPEALSRWLDVYKEGMGRLNRLIRTLYPSAEKEDVNEFLIVFRAQLIGSYHLMGMDEKQIGARMEKNIPTGVNYYREIICHAVESLLNPWV